MKINTKATGISLTPSISEYVEKKAGMLKKYFSEEDDVLINVEVGKTTRHHKSGDVFRAEMRLAVNGDTYYAVVETEDLYAAIDEVKDEVAYKLSSKKKKTVHLLRRGGAQIKNLIKGVADLGSKGWRKFRKK